MTRKSILKLGGALVLGFAVSGCEPTAVGFGVNYGYNDPFYWNDYYYRRNVDIDIDVPDRPQRPDRPVRPPVAKPKPPIAKPPSVRPPTHKPARPSRPTRPSPGRLR
jgi:hypothetical protein